MTLDRLRDKMTAMIKVAGETHDASLSAAAAYAKMAEAMADFQAECEAIAAEIAAAPGPAPANPRRRH
jgi:hypothetical protein